MNRQSLFTKLAIIGYGVAIMSLGAIALAQQKPVSNPAPANKAVTNTLHFETNIGSFKMLDGNGTIKFDFEGTVLLSNVKGTIKPSPGLKLEYDSHDRKGYFGKGSMEVTGDFRAIQWFGKNMHGVWTGSQGKARMFGEFDKNLNTGTYWYDEDPRKKPWYTSGFEIGVVETEAMKPVQAKERSGG